MPRYDDRYGAHLYVGRLSSRTRSRDLENLFRRYGRVRGVELKHDFAFIEFSDPRDADDARYNLDGRQFDGSRIIVEFAKGGPRGSGGSREYLGRGPPPGSGRCFNCGIDGHWARDCKAGDRKNRCYRCGERGHIERNCQNSPKNLKPGWSYSRSRSRSPARRGRSRSRGRGYSPSRSPPRREWSVDCERSRSPRYSRSPEPKSSPFKRARSPSPQDGSPRERGGPPREPRHDAPRDGSLYSGSPRGNVRSPSVGRDGPDGRYRGPETNGRTPSLRDNGTPVEDADDNRGYPRGSHSPSGSQD